MQLKLFLLLWAAALQCLACASGRYSQSEPKQHTWQVRQALCKACMQASCSGIQGDLAKL